MNDRDSIQTAPESALRVSRTQKQIATVASLPRDDEPACHCEEPVRATRQAACEEDKQMKGRSPRSLRSLAMTNPPKQNSPFDVLCNASNTLLRGHFVSPYDKLRAHPSRCRIKKDSHPSPIVKSMLNRIGRSIHGEKGPYNQSF